MVPEEEVGNCLSASSLWAQPSPGAHRSYAILCWALAGSERGNALEGVKVVDSMAPLWGNMILETGFFTSQDSGAGPNSFAHIAANSQDYRPWRACFWYYGT